MSPRITVSLRPDGSFELFLNEAGRDLLIAELSDLDREWDHFHLDHYDDPDTANATAVALSSIPYRSDDQVLRSGKVLLRPDDWDREHFPHVMPVELRGDDTIKALVQRVVDGGDVLSSELELLPPDLELSEAAETALHQLHHWVSDADIRQKDPVYAAATRDGFRQLLVVLSAP